MFDRILNRLSLRRSTAGIYYELRTLRQMAEILFKEYGFELPSERRARRKSEADLDVNPPSEEQLAAARARQIRIDELEGRDPGTTWREDPNR